MPKMCLKRFITCLLNKNPVYECIFALVMFCTFLIHLPVGPSVKLIIYSRSYEYIKIYTLELCNIVVSL